MYVLLLKPNYYYDIMIESMIESKNSRELKISASAPVFL